jgi:hypothetical protein
MQHLVDPAVSRKKFERELAQYREIEDEYIRRGWWILKAEFPEVFVVFATPNAQPPLIPFGAILDFTNYDFWPPSVRLVNPFTRLPYKHKELLTKLPRAVLTQVPSELAAVGIVGEVQIQQVQELLQAFDPEEIPFLCVAGVREYHESPAHTNDPWLFRRGTGPGTLYFLLNVLYHYGVEKITGCQFQIRIAGYSLSEFPQ